MPDVKGKDVLNAGCGLGLYAEILLERGATVPPIDISPNMIHFAKERLGNRAIMRYGTLEEPLEFLANNS